jgi:hypothetical protein
MKYNKLRFIFYGLFLPGLIWTGISTAKDPAPRGASGPQDLRSGLAKNGGNPKTAQYDLELLPGQVFTGWYYFWLVSGDPISANLAEEIDQPWLSVSPTTFTSSGCDDIVPVEFFFQAPDSEGDYSVRLIDANGNWDQIDVNMTVTSDPDIVDDRFLEIPPLGTAVQFDTIGWYGLANMSCLDLYVPGDSATAKYTLYPAVDWLTITPSEKTFGLNQTGLIRKDFMIGDAGSYDVYEVLEGQWFSWPRFIHWSINVPSAVEANSGHISPMTFALGQNYPNPFNPSTVISWQLAVGSMVDLSVYNVLGEKVSTLVSKWMNPGNHSARFDGTDLPSGVYYYHITAGEFRDVKKMILLR